MKESQSDKWEGRQTRTDSANRKDRRTGYGKGKGSCAGWMGKRNLVRKVRDDVNYSERTND